jgi:hypothetical protein
MSLPITQEHGMGCGVACVAYVLKITYQKALKLFSNPKAAWGEGYYCQDIIHALKRAGVSYTFYPAIKLPKQIKSGVIVFIQPCKKYPEGHYLASTPQGHWMNSWINFPVIACAESGFQERLPSKVCWIIEPVEK